VSGIAADQSVGAVARASPAEVQKRAAWCMIRAKREQSHLSLGNFLILLRTLLLKGS
jgi:hypothetical protein